MMYTEGEFGIFPAKSVKGLAPNKQTVLAWLIFHTNTNTGVAFPSINTLCAECGIASRTTMIKVLSELEKEGYIKKKHRQREGGGYTSNEYEVFIKRTSPSTKSVSAVVQEVDTNHKKKNQKKLEHWSEQFQRCFNLWNKGNFKHSLKYWGELEATDRDLIERNIPIFLKKLDDDKYKPFFQNWINPEYCKFRDVKIERIKL